MPSFANAISAISMRLDANPALPNGYQFDPTLKKPIASLSKEVSFETVMDASTLWPAVMLTCSTSEIVSEFDRAETSAET